MRRQTKSKKTASIADRSPSSKNVAQTSLQPRRARPAKSRKAGRGQLAPTEMQQLLFAKKLVDQMGGIEAARSAVDGLAKLLN